MIRTNLWAIVLSVSFPLAAQAVEAHHEPKTAVSPAAGQLSEGEVRKVDKDAKKITVRHGPIPSLGMPDAMTMVYRVKDPAMLEQVKPGDKIRFGLEKAGGQYTLTRIEPAM